MPVRRPAGTEDDARGLHVPLATTVVTAQGALHQTVRVAVARGEVRVEGHGVPLFAVEVVRVIFSCDTQTGTVRGNIALTAGARRHIVFPDGLVVLSHHGLGADPGEIRWLAEAIAQRIQAQRGVDLVVLPRIPPGEPVQPPEHPEPERPSAPSLPRGVTRTPDGLTFDGEVRGFELPAVMRRLGVLWIAALVVGVAFGLPYPVVGLGLMLGLWFIGLYLGYSRYRRRLSPQSVEASPLGLTLDGVWREWEEVGSLTLEGSCPGPLRLRDAEHRVVCSWPEAGWTDEVRILDIVHFCESLAALGGVFFVDDLGDKAAWRDFEHAALEHRAGREFWRSLHEEIRFARFRAEPPEQPSGAVADHTGWTVPLPSVAITGVGGRVNTKRAWETKLNADRQGIGVGQDRIPWTEIDAVELAFRRWSDRRSVEIHGRLEVVVGGAARGLRPWVTLEVDGTEAIPAGEMTWLVQTVRDLWQQHAPSEEGVAAEVPAALRALRARRQSS